MQAPGASPLSGMASAVQAMGTAVGGIAGFASGNYNASIARQNATIAEQSSAAATANSDMQFRAALGKQLANVGASGVWGNAGSPLDAAAQTRTEQTYNAMQIMRNAQIRAQGFNEQASMDQSSGLSKLIAGITGATSGIMKTQTDYANANNQYGYDPLSAAGAVQPLPTDLSVISRGTFGGGPNPDGTISLANP